MNQSSIKLFALGATFGAVIVTAAITITQCKTAQCPVANVAAEPSPPVEIVQPTVAAVVKEPSVYVSSVAKANMIEWSNLGAFPDDLTIVEFRSGISASQIFDIKLKGDPVTVTAWINSRMADNEEKGVKVLTGPFFDGRISYKYASDKAGNSTSIMLDEERGIVDIQGVHGTNQR